VAAGTNARSRVVCVKDFLAESKCLYDCLFLGEHKSGWFLATDHFHGKDKSSEVVFLNRNQVVGYYDCERKYLCICVR